MKFFVEQDIAKAKTIHTAFYTDANVFEAAKEKIFASSWQYVGYREQVPEEGSAYPFILLEHYLSEPLLLTKSGTNTLHCMSNVCTHRGNLLVYEACKVKNLRCKYHGRQFSLDGKFLSMPEFKEVENFPTREDNLHSLPLFEWGPLLFTSLDPQVPAGMYMKEMIERIRWMPIEKLVFDPQQSRDYIVEANWALYCENYLEGFHIPFVHAGLNQVLDFSAYTTEVFRYCNLQLGIGKKGDSCFDIPHDSPDFGKQVVAYYFWLFPNMMFNFYPWGLSLNVVEPLSIDRCKVRFLTFVFDATKLEQGAGSGLDTVEMEDEDVVQKVQKGIRSRFYSQGRYSVTREQGTHHFHSLLASHMS